MTDFSPVDALFRTDAYKCGHLAQYRLAGTVTRVYSNYTNRKPIERDTDIAGVVHFGLQAYIQRDLMDAFEPFFAADEDLVTDLYVKRVHSVLGPDCGIDGEHIRALHRLGYLPLVIRAVDEGTIVPFGVPSLTIENTIDEFFWLTNYIETSLSANLWHPSTVATIAASVRADLNRWAKHTTGLEHHPATDFQLHDFSYRGQTCDEAAAASGAAHLLSSYGTDSLVSLSWIDRYYGGEYIAASVPATEHSVMMAGGASVGEMETFNRLLDFYPKGILSVVSDTWDLWKVCTEYLPALKDKIMGRDGKLVIRPDSGDPVDIVCGLNSKPGAVFTQQVRTPQGDPDYFGVVELLWNTFGGTVNEAGFKELDPHIGVIYGDSITRERANAICERLAAKGFASTNIVFGIGSFSYQYVTRDTFGSAVKATWSCVDGEGRDMFKNPVTDSGTKRSATGRLAVVRDDGGKLTLIQRASAEDEARSELHEVWRDGAFTKRQSFAEVRATLDASRKELLR